ncbi:F-box protein SKIP23 [Ziziphus jujuba]|uniref:F-box protein SKIP23 n=1 Tax=Ziziphus jujuba TaxID=326968 RepID=A0A6P3ZGG6_ZIZJJ|nr:F-box protein SKIP23 [Ziziphus jujuba]
MVSTPSSMWPSLPPEILEEIAMRLESRTDILHLRAVCTAWRASIPLPSKNPHNLSFSIASNNWAISGHFLVRERTVYCIQPLKKISSFFTNNNNNNNWLVNIEERDFGKVRATAPFSLCKIIPNWDKFSMIGGLSKKVINLLDYKVREVGKSYYLLFNLDFFKNVVVGRCNNEDGFWVMFIHFGKLRFWKMGDEKWTQVDDGSGQSNYVHIALHNGTIYAVDYTGLTIAVDPLSLEVTQVASHPYLGFHKYLVNSLGDLFLIDKVEDSSGGGEPCLKVYKLDEKRGEWIPVNSLGDQVILLMGSGCCCSVSAKDFGGLRRNCVYFGDHYFRDVQNDFPRWPVGFFDFEYNVVQPLKSVDIKIFLPKPAWLS